MNIVFCADRRVLPGLHVAAYSLLRNIGPGVGTMRLAVFSDDLTEGDMGRLRVTLNSLEKPYALDLRAVSRSLFDKLPPLNGSWATYYRLMIPQTQEEHRFLYVDADTLCEVDVGPLARIEMNGAAAALVPEATLAGCGDRAVAQQLGNSPHEPYFNAGVMLVDVKQWRRQRITERAMDHLSRHQVSHWDQSALNVVLHGTAKVLDPKYNCIANMRHNWPALRQGPGKIATLIHFLDYPKPWDFLGEFVHPQYKLWRGALDKTEVRGFRTWHNTPARQMPRTRKAWHDYKKAIKDRLLFAAYSRGWISRVKGMA